MSNDLISRSEVLKTLEYVFNKYSMTWDKQGGFAKEVPESIRNLPTAYDVDKVVEKMKCNECEKCNFIEACAGSRYCGECHKKIIEIVKAGGESDNYRR